MYFNSINQNVTAAKVPAVWVDLRGETKRASFKIHLNSGTSLMILPDGDVAGLDDVQVAGGRANQVIRRHIVVPQLHLRGAEG